MAKGHINNKNIFSQISNGYFSSCSVYSDINHPIIHNGVNINIEINNNVNNMNAMLIINIYSNIIIIYSISISIILVHSLLLID